jgi:hypothetical protein
VNLATRHADVNVAAVKPVQVEDADERGVLRDGDSRMPPLISTTAAFASGNGLVIGCQPRPLLS